MKHIPMLFSTLMVQSIIDQLKTNTRRTKGLDVVNKIPGHWDYAKILKGSELPETNRIKKVDSEALYACFGNNANDEWLIPILCPYGKPGDIIWVREKFRIASTNAEDGEITFGFMVGDTTTQNTMLEWEQIYKYTEQCQDDLLKAGYDMDDEGRFKNVDLKHLRVRPSIHMPKDAARIWLQVTEIKLERLLDISEEDAKAEGVEPVETRLGAGFKYYHHMKLKRVSPATSTAYDSFLSLWSFINGDKSLRSNPWVWVVKFKVLSTTGKPHEL